MEMPWSVFDCGHDEKGMFTPRNPPPPLPQFDTNQTDFYSNTNQSFTLSDQVYP